MKPPLITRPMMLARMLALLVPAQRAANGGAELAVVAGGPWTALVDANRAPDAGRIAEDSVDAS